MNKDERKLNTTTATTLKDKSGYNRQRFDWRQWGQADIQVPVQEPGHCLSFQLRFVEAWGVAWRVGDGGIRESKTWFPIIRCKKNHLVNSKVRSQQKAQK